MGLLKGQGEISGFRGMPTDSNGSSQKVFNLTESLVFYFFNAGVKTVDAGQAAGTKIIGYLGARNIKNSSGKIMACKNDTSLALTFAALDQEVKMDNVLMEVGDEITEQERLLSITSNLTAGQYVVDYNNGIIYGVKKTNATSASVTYKYQITLTALVDSAGNQISSFGGASTVADYKSPSDFSAVYTSASTITISGVTFTLTDSSQVVYVKIIKAANTSDIYINGQAGYTFTLNTTTGVISAYKNGVATSIFTTGDVYEVGINAQDKAFNLSTNSQMSSVLNPESSKYVQDSLVDTTNVAAATNYYPSSTGMSMDGYKDFSLSGKFIDADGTMTLRIEATNDEDTTNADWIDISLLGIDSKTGINVITAAMTVTNGTLTFGIEYNDLNYSNIRVKMVNNGATNTAIIKARRKAL